MAAPPGRTATITVGRRTQRRRHRDGRAAATTAGRERVRRGQANDEHVRGAGQW